MGFSHVKRMGVPYQPKPRFPAGLFFNSWPRGSGGDVPAPGWHILAMKYRAVTAIVAVVIIIALVWAYQRAFPAGL
jgi:hypothetical protein